MAGAGGLERIELADGGQEDAVEMALVTLDELDIVAAGERQRMPAAFGVFACFPAKSVEGLPVNLVRLEDRELVGNDAVQAPGIEGNTAGQDMLDRSNGRERVEEALEV